MMTGPLLAWIQKLAVQHFKIYLLNTLQKHQTIPTNATVSKVSDIEIQWWSMRKLDF